MTDVIGLVCDIHTLCYKVYPKLYPTTMSLPCVRELPASMFVAKPAEFIDPTILLHLLSIPSLHVRLEDSGLVLFIFFFLTI